MEFEVNKMALTMSLLFNSICLTVKITLLCNNSYNQTWFMEDKGENANP